MSCGGQFDLSILLSTHDFDTLRTYSDQVILLKETVLDSGTPAEVLGSPGISAGLSPGPGERGRQA